MQDKRFSISRVRLRNYKNIATADVCLGPLLILVGPNGAGKSSFLDALLLVSEALRTSLDQVLRSRGGAGQVRRRHPGGHIGFAIDLEFHGPGYTGTYGFEVAALAEGGFRIRRERCSLRPDQCQQQWFDVCDGALVTCSEPVMPPVSDQRLYLVSAAGLEVFRPVLEGLSGISVFDPAPQAMSKPQAPDAGEALRGDGSNIASVLRRLERSAAGRRGKERIEDYLRQLVPGLHKVSRADLGRWEALAFVQDVPGAKAPWRFTAQSASDGALRALGVLVGLFSDLGPTLSPAGLEEPMRGLHPAAAGVMLDALRDASERRQVVVTSHSPDLLVRDDFELSELCAVGSQSGKALIGQVDPAGALALKEQLHTPGL